MNIIHEYLWNAYLATDVVVEVVSPKIAKEDWLRVGGGVGRVHGRLECHARSVDRRDDHGRGVCGVGGGSDHGRAGARNDLTCYCTIIVIIVSPCHNELSISPHPRMRPTPVEEEYGARRGGQDQSGYNLQRFMQSTWDLFVCRSPEAEFLDGN